MPTKLVQNLTEEEKNNPVLVDRLIELNENHIKNLKESKDYLLQEIRNKESVAIYWINLMVVLAILQILPALSEDLSKYYIITCLPSFVFAFYSASFTLMKHPSVIKPDFATTEKANKQVRLGINEAEITALTNITKYLQKNYNRKMKYGKYIGPAVTVNFTMSIALILMRTFMPNSINICTSFGLGTISIISIYCLAKLLTRSVLFTYKIPLNK